MREPVRAGLVVAWAMILASRCAAPVSESACAIEADCPAGFTCRDRLCTRAVVPDASVDGAPLDVHAQEFSASDRPPDGGLRDRPASDVAATDDARGDGSLGDRPVAQDLTTLDVNPPDVTVVDSAGVDQPVADQSIADHARADLATAGERPPCASPVECDDGQPCNGLEACTGGRCVSPGNPCSGLTPICLTGTGGNYLCVQCTDPAHCAPRNLDFCVANVCADCVADDDCDDVNDCTGEACTAGTCGNPPIGRGEPCAGGHCDGAGACVECTDSAHCLDPAAPVCVDDHCVECAAQLDCDDGVECTSDQCLVGNVCSNTGLTRGTPCAGGYCDGSTTCVDCTVDGHCAGLPGTPYCRGDTCVECVGAGDCNDNKPCTVDGCSAAFACTHTSVGEGQKVAGCAWYCDGDGNCDYCTRDLHCQSYGYGECYTCQGGSCQIQQGRICTAYNCNEYVWGLYDDGNRVRCYSYDAQVVTGFCELYGGCSQPAPPSNCSWSGGYATEITSCSSSCARTDSTQDACSAGSPTSTVSVADLCVTNQQTSTCQGRSCANFSSVAYQYWTHCTSWGECQNSVEDYCQNHLCVVTGSNDAACDESCADVSECVSGPGGNVVMSCESGLCCERGTYVDCS